MYKYDDFLGRYHGIANSSGSKRVVPTCKGCKLWFIPAWYYSNSKQQRSTPLMVYCKCNKKLQGR